MKWALVATFIIAVVTIVVPWPSQIKHPLREPRFGTRQPLLPMTFAHNDHFTVACATCHHEFIDDTAGGPPCMTCHVTAAKVAPLLEEQFHGLCRSCHVNEHAAGQRSGPTRSCIACHMPDDHF